MHWKDNNIFHLSFLFLSVKNWNSDSLVNRILVAKGNLKWRRQQFSISQYFHITCRDVLLRNQAKTPGLPEKQGLANRNYESYQVGTGTTDRFPDSGHCTCYKLIVKTYSHCLLKPTAHLDLDIWDMREIIWVLALQNVLETPKNEDYLHSTSFSHSVHVLMLITG